MRSAKDVTVLLWCRKNRNTRGFDDNLKSAERDEINPRRRGSAAHRGDPGIAFILAKVCFSQSSGRAKQLPLRVQWESCPLISPLDLKT
jgi:hypothetical protein